MTTIPLRAFPSLGGRYQPQFIFVGSASKTQTHVHSTLNLKIQLYYIQARIIT